LAKRMTQRSLEALAAKVLSIETRHDARRTAEAGRRILDEVYDGDVAAFRNKDHTKGQSLNALARLLGRSVGRVWGLIVGAIVYEGLPKDLRDALSPGHLEALDGAAEIEQERLARECVALGLTVEELRARVAGEILPDPPPPPRDRSPMAQAERGVAGVERLVETASDEDVPELDRRLDTLIARLTAAREHLHRRSRT
jgi:hypothetical protein